MPDGSAPAAETSSGPAMAPPSRLGWRGGRLRSRWVTIAAVVLLAFGLLSGVVWGARSQTVTPVPPNSVGPIGPHGLVSDAVALGPSPVALVEAAGSVWVLNEAESTVSRVDPGARRVVQTIPDVGQDPHAIAASGNDLWVAALGTPVVTRVSATANRVVDRITVGNQPAAVVASAEATDAAAFLTIGNHKRLDVVSERVGNLQQRGGVGPAISQLWVTPSPPVSTS